MKKQCINGNLNAIKEEQGNMVCKGVFIGAFSITDVGTTGRNKGRILKDISGYLNLLGTYEYLDVCHAGLLACGYVEKEYFNSFRVTVLKEKIREVLSEIDQKPAPKDLYEDGDGRYFYLS